MSAASYNRGSGSISRDADARMPLAIKRADRDARNDETERLRAQVATLERDLGRARRCIAELRRSKDQRLAEARRAIDRGDAAISILCRLAFHGRIPSVFE